MTVTPCTTAQSQPTTLRQPRFHSRTPARGGEKILLRQGMALAIEPMITLGGADVRILDDGWTAVTKDGSMAAHFEHTIVITTSGPEILSASKR